MPDPWDIDRFATELEAILRLQTPSDQYPNEAAFEREHVAKPAWELSREHPEIRVYTHPWKKKQKCGAVCKDHDTPHAQRVEGCPRCWALSKEWQVAKVFGTRHTFDVVARDSDGQSLAVEVKWLSLKGGRGPNGPVQGFIGQCVIARAVHRRVIGVCCFRGTPKPTLTRDNPSLREPLDQIRVGVVDLYANRRVT